MRDSLTAREAAAAAALGDGASVKLIDNADPLRAAIIGGVVLSASSLLRLVRVGVLEFKLTDDFVAETDGREVMTALAAEDTLLPSFRDATRSMSRALHSCGVTMAQLVEALGANRR